MITKTHHFIPSSTGMIPVVCAPLWSASPGAHRGKLSDRQQSWCLRRASAPKNRDPAVKRPEIPAIYNSNLWNDHNPIYSHKWAIKINPDNGFEAFISGHSKTHWNARRTVIERDSWLFDAMQSSGRGEECGNPCAQPASTSTHRASLAQMQAKKSKATSNDHFHGSSAEKFWYQALKFVASSYFATLCWGTHMKNIETPWDKWF